MRIVPATLFRRLAVASFEWTFGRRLPATPEDPIAAGYLSMGEHSYGVPKVNVYNGDTGMVSIGKFCSTAPDVEVFVGGNHRTDWVSTYPFRIMLDLPGALQDGVPTSKGNVSIGHDVWIGKGAKILSGVTIGNGSVIGAYSVVAREVRSYAVVVGNPAVEVKRRFSDEHISMLESIAWWDWPIEKIREAVPLLSSANIDDFVAQWVPSEEQ